MLFICLQKPLENPTFILLKRESYSETVPPQFQTFCRDFFLLARYWWVLNTEGLSFLRFIINCLNYFWQSNEAGANRELNKILSEVKSKYLFDSYCWIWHVCCFRIVFYTYLLDFRQNLLFCWTRTFLLWFGIRNKHIANCLTYVLLEIGSPLWRFLIQSFWFKPFNIYSGLWLCFVLL